MATDEMILDAKSFYFDPTLKIHKKVFSTIRHFDDMIWSDLVLFEVKWFFYRISKQQKSLGAIRIDTELK